MNLYKTLQIFFEDGDLDLKVPKDDSENIKFTLKLDGSNEFKTGFKNQKEKDEIVKTLTNKVFELPLKYFKTIKKEGFVRILTDKLKFSGVLYPIINEKLDYNLHGIFIDKTAKAEDNLGEGFDINLKPEFRIETIWKNSNGEIIIKLGYVPYKKINEEINYSEEAKITSKNYKPPKQKPVYIIRAKDGSGAAIGASSPEEAKRKFKEVSKAQIKSIEKFDVFN